MPRKLLLLLAHPALERSRIHVRMLEVARELCTIHDLYETYPRLVIDPRREQALLSDHDALVLQHPMYWYSTPGLLKDWQDLVLEHGWAYGDAGTALRGKLWLNALSTGAPAVAYAPTGRLRHTVRQLLAPHELTAGLCGMRFLPPFVIHGAHLLEGGADLQPSLDAYAKLLVALRDDTLDLDRAEALDALNALVS